MEPIPESMETLRRLGDETGHTHLVAELQKLADQARSVVPDLMAVSVSELTEGLTFTLAALPGLAGALDAVQYLDGGPCVEAARTGQVTAYDAEGIMDESRWRLFAEATAASSIRATLTLPLLLAGALSLTVNLYATSAEAFRGHHDELAALFDTQVDRLVGNADLSFSTLSAARAGPDRVSDGHEVDVAVGLLADRTDVSREEAERRVYDAAARADVTPATLSRLIIEVHRRGQGR